MGDKRKREEMKEKLAHFLSLILHPSAVAIYLFTSAFYHTKSEFIPKLLWALLAIFFSALVPALVVLGLLKLRLLSDADISNRAERARPYILITLFYFLGSFLLLHLPPHPINKVYGTLMSCYATVTLVGTIITYFWKISMHLAGLAGPLTARYSSGNFPPSPSSFPSFPSPGHVSTCENTTSGRFWLE
jgi:hypothetical protein